MQSYIYFLLLFLFIPFASTAQSFNEAVDNNELSFSHGGNAEWTVTTETTTDGEDAVRSGSINHNQSSYFETTVTGPGILYFHWKVSSEGSWDFLRYYINGVLQERISGSTDWVQKEISIPEGSQTIRWAYTKDGSVDRYEDCGWVDQIYFQNCAAPTNLTFEDVTINSVELEWTDPNSPENWTLEYGETGFTPGEGTPLTINTTNYSLTDLSEKTAYDVYVRANCQTDGESFWTGPVTFKTLAICPDPTNIAFENITTSSVDLECFASHSPNKWELEYGESGFTQGEGTSHTIYRNNSSFRNLNTDTQYDVYVKAHCTRNDESDWAGPFSFETMDDSPIQTFNDAVNNHDLTFSLGGNADWTITTETSWNGEGSVKSGPISNNQSSYFETTVEGPGLIEFRWKVSSLPNYFHKLGFYIDGSLQKNIGGVTDWLIEKIYIPEGEHTIRWDYYKKGWIAGQNEDCGWVDRIQYSKINENCSPTINANFSEIDANNATIQWETGDGENPVSWEIEYGEALFLPGEGTNHISYLKNYPLINLTPGTNYHVYIKAYCGPENESNWNGPYSFQTIDDASNDNSCPTATSWSADEITSSSANLQWESSSASNPISWEIEYGEADFTPGDGTTRISYMNSSLLHGLSQGTSYDVYLKANCGSTAESDWVGPYAFQTAEKNPNETPISFSEAIDNQNIIITPGGYTKWDVTTETTYDGEDAVKSGKIPHYQLSYFETTIDGPGILTFQWKVSSESNCDFLRYYLNGSLQQSISGRIDWEEKEITIPQGSHTIRWEYTKDGSVNYYEDCGWIDQITYSEAGEECLTALELFSNNTTAYAADLHWVEYVSPISWNIEYGESGFSQGEGTLQTSYTNNYTLMGLSPETNYDYYVQASCGTDNESEWSTSHTFRTADNGSNDDNCAEPTNLYPIETTRTTVNLQWDAPDAPISWTLEYGESGFSQGEGTVLTSYMKKYFLSNLIPGTTYDVYVQSYCGPNTPNSNWAGPYSFNTNCGAIDVPFTENFDQVEKPSLPACWSKTGKRYYEVSTIYASNRYNSPPTAVQLYRGYDSDAALISPEINQPLSSIRVNFNASYYDYYNTRYTPTIIVGTISDPTDLSTFTTVETIELTSEFDVDQQEITVYLSGHNTDDSHIVFKTSAEFSHHYYYIYIDDITIDFIPNNPEPTNLAISRIDENRVSLSWTDIGYNTSWEIKYGLEDFNPDIEGTSVIVFQQEAILNNLEHGFVYDAYVRVAGTQQSEWSQLKKFTTLDPQLGRSKTDINPSNVDNVSTAINDQEEENKNKHSVSVYPNPVKDELIIMGENLSPDEVVIITDLSGKTMMTTTVREQPLDLSSFPEGVYLLRMDGKVLKIIKE